MARTKEMTSGAILPLILAFTVPLLLGNLLQQTYSLVDAAIVGRFLGINSLAAVGASSSIIFLILGFCNGCSGGFAIPIAQKFGARDYATMRSYVTHSYYITTVFSIAIAIITTLLCASILHWMQTPGPVFRDAYFYLLITFIGIPCTFFYNLLSCIIRALGDSKTPFWFLLFSTVLNILLDLLCIIVLGWGVKGAAIATVVSQGISAVLCYVYMMRHFPILRGNADERRFNPRLIGNLLGIGVPMGLQFSITAIGSIMLQSANNALGTECMAAFTAGIRIKMFFMCPFESLGMAMATFTGQNFGAGKLLRISQGVREAIRMMLVYASFTIVILFIFSRTFTLIFVDPAQTGIIHNAVMLLKIECCFFPILGILCILRYTIQGAGYTAFSMFSGVAEMIARILVSLLIVPAFGFLGVCIGDPVAWVFADLFLVPAYLYVYRRLALIIGKS